MGLSFGGKGGEGGGTQGKQNNRFQKGDSGNAVLSHADGVKQPSQGHSLLINSQVQHTLSCCESNLSLTSPADRLIEDYHTVTLFTVTVSLYRYDYTQPRQHSVSQNPFKCHKIL